MKIKPYFNIKEVLDSTKLCMSSWLNILLVAVLDIIMNLVISMHYKEVGYEGYLNVYSIINFTINFSEILTAAGSSGSIIWSIAKGEENNTDMYNTTKVVRKFNYIIIASTTIFFVSFSWFWPYLYGVTDSPFSFYGFISCLILSISNIFSGLIYSYTYYYLSQDNIFPSLIAGTSNMFIFPLALSIPLSYTGLGFYGYIVGFALSPLLSWLLLLFFLYKRHGKGKNFPFFLPKVNEKQYCFNLEIDQKSIIELRNEVEKLLKTQKINKQLINRILLTVEESYMMIYEKNIENQKEITKKGKKPKTILSELFVGFRKNEIRLIEKDNGVLFELSNQDQEIKSLRTHVFLQALSFSKSKQSNIEVATNTNKFVFSRHITK